VSADAAAVLDLLARSGALRQGHFLLSSGLHSPAYVQCALLLQEPARARRVGRALADRLRDLNADSVLSPALGGVILGHEVAVALAVPFRFVERSGAGFAMRRGFSLNAGERVVLVEDVVTTGLSTREAAAVAESQGAVVAGYGALLDRGGGATLPGGLRSLARLDFPVYEPAQCPLCAGGSVVEKPGSRPGA
jgi:orotate phosphoribosyltransferase